MTRALLCRLLALLALLAPAGAQGHVLVVGPPADQAGSIEIESLAPDGSVRARAEPAPDPSLRAFDGFGAAVTAIGDLDGDGLGELAVGVPGALQSSGFGEVRILFLDAAGSIRRMTRIGEPNSHEFGLNLAALGDLDGDGVPDLAVDSQGGWWILFLGRDGELRSSRYQPTGCVFPCRHTMAAIGDLDGDGVTELARGWLPSWVYIDFLRADGSVKRSHFMRLGSFIAGNYAEGFGACVAAPGDLDGDGIPDLIVGEADDTDVLAYAGALWIVHLTAAGDVRGAHKIDQANGVSSLMAGDHFGSSAAFLGDLDGDGRPEVAVGGPGRGGALSPEHGRVWVLSLEPDGSVFAERSFEAVTPRSKERFGASLAALGDLDGDGVSELVVGIPGKDRPATGIPTLQGAVDQAQDGDVLLVRAGDYSGAVFAGKSLTVQVETDHLARVINPSAITGLGAAQSLRLRGLVFHGLELRGNAGVVWIEDCASRDYEPGVSVPPSIPGLRVEDSTVVLLRTTCHGSSPSCDALGGAGLATSDLGRGSAVHAYDCTFIGANAYYPDPYVCSVVPTPGQGVWSRNPADVLFLSGCRVQGGEGDGCNPALYACDGVDGGTGLESAGATRLLDCEVLGGRSEGIGSFGSGCYHCGSDGIAWTGNVQRMQGAALSASATSPVREGGTVTVRVEGPPHAPVWLGVADAPAAVPAFVGLGGTLLIPYPFAHTAFVGFTDDAGKLERSQSPWILPPGVEGRPQFWQFYYLDLNQSSPLQTRGHARSAVTGYQLGAGTMIVGLDSAF